VQYYAYLEFLWEHDKGAWGEAHSTLNNFTFLDTFNVFDTNFDFVCIRLVMQKI